MMVLDQYFSEFNVHMSYLRILLQYKFLLYRSGVGLSLKQASMLMLLFSSEIQGSITITFKSKPLYMT